MKTVLSIILLLFFYTNLQSQGLTQVVKGKVIDLDSEMPIIGANIVLLGSDPIVGATTNINGIYKLPTIPIGRQSFKISFIGYEDVFLREQLIETGKEAVFNVSMKEVLSELKAVVIKANDNKSEAINQMTTVSANQITIESTSRIAAGINDPGRTVQSLAGVATSSDKTNELVIRGNSPRGVLWRMEGVEIPNPNHFSSEGGSGGGVSALSTQVLANSDFITSAFPAEYGNAISGVYDLKLRNGNSDKREYTLQFGVLGLQLAAEGPFKKGSQASYLFNYRYSTFSLLNKTIGSTMGGYIPTWQDLSFKIYVPTKKAGYFSLWGLGGNSIYEDLAVKDSSQWDNKYDNRQETSINSLGIIGLTHNYLFKDNKTYLKTTVAYSATNNHFVNDTLNYNYDAFATLDLKYKYDNINFSSFVNHKFNAKHLIRVGANYTINGYNIETFNYHANTGKMEEIGSTSSLQSYVQWKYRITNEIDIISGIHSSYLLLNGKYTIEPRLGLKWQLDKKNTLSFGFGVHSKSEPASVYLTEIQHSNGTITQPNKNLDFTKAIHYVLGYNWNFADDFRLKAELYYQHIYSVPIDNNDTTGTRSSLNFRTRIPDVKLTNDGTGRNYGVELTLEKFFSKNWYALITSSIFDSKYTMPGFDERNTLFNSNYIFNFVGGKEYKFGKNDQNILGLNIRTIWRGGYRTIPYNESESIKEDKPIYDYNDSYGQRLPDYYRIDLGINYSRNTENLVWKISVDIQNITNNKNIRRQYYDYEKKEIINLYSQGLVPNINFLISF
ncbi:MAG: TonB-dependent receptor [Bacteroidales bacterium]|nr:TonB-dependent receptor [Bacteroidales bacterium]